MGVPRGTCAKERGGGGGLGMGARAGRGGSEGRWLGGVGGLTVIVDLPVSPFTPCVLKPCFLLQPIEDLYVFLLE